MSKDSTPTRSDIEFYSWLKTSELLAEAFDEVERAAHSLRCPVAYGARQRYRASWSGCRS